VAVEPGLIVKITASTREFERQVCKATSAFAGLLAILNGQSGPPKLCIDGREYHRRQRRRTKTNRG
jgi:hypothetical protein